MTNGNNLALNIGTLVAVLIALVVGGVIATDIYNIVDNLGKQSARNGDYLNNTITSANSRGNETEVQLIGLSTQVNKTLLQVNNTLVQMFNLISGLDSNTADIIGNITDHRIIANESYNKIFEKLNITEKLEDPRTLEH